MSLTEKCFKCEQIHSYENSLVHLWLGLTYCCINSTNKSDFGFELVLQFARKTNMNKNQTEKKNCKKKRALQNDLSFVDKFLLYFWLITMVSTPLLIFIFCIAMHQCCRSWSCTNKHHARSSSKPVLGGILCTEASTPIGILWEREWFHYWCRSYSVCEYFFSSLCWFLFYIFIVCIDVSKCLPTHLLITISCSHI